MKKIELGYEKKIQKGRLIIIVFAFSIYLLGWVHVDFTTDTQTHITLEHTQSYMYLEHTHIHIHYTIVT